MEKFQGPCGNSVSASPACDQEEQIIEPLRAVKAIDPNISTVFYYNSVLDFPQYKLHARMLADPSLMLRDKDGNIVRMSAPTQVPGHTTDVFDFSNPRARALFIEECVNTPEWNNALTLGGRDMFARDVAAPRPANQRRVRTPPSPHWPLVQGSDP